MIEFLLILSAVFTCISSILSVTILILAAKDKHEQLKVDLSMALMLLSLLTAINLIVVLVMALT
jgi:hypothetical protein